MAKIISRKTALELAAPPDNKTKVHIAFGDTEDIITTIMAADKESAKFTTKLAPLFRGVNDRETCLNIFNFVFTQIQYDLDPEGQQYIKSPSRTIHDGTADCKSMSLLSGSLLKNLKIPFQYRFTTYSPEKAKNGLVSHVYVVAQTKQGQIIIDPVYKKFNEQKPYLFKKDIMPEISYIAGIETSKKMRVIRVIRNQAKKPIIKRVVSKQHVLSHAGLDRKKIHRVAVFGNDEDDAFVGSVDIEDISGFFSNLAKKLQGAVKSVSKSASHFAKEVGKKTKQFIKYKNQEVQKKEKDFKHFTKEVGKKTKQAIRYKNEVATKASKIAKKAFYAIKRINPANVLIRSAIEGLVRINLFGMATKIGRGYLSLSELKAKGFTDAQAKQYQTAKNKLANFFVEFLGGAEGDFRKFVMFGYSKKTFLTGFEDENEERIGVLPAALAVPIAAAAPFITLFTKLLGGAAAVAKVVEKAKTVVETVKDVKQTASNIQQAVKTGNFSSILNSGESNSSPDLENDTERFSSSIPNNAFVNQNGGDDSEENSDSDNSDQEDTGEEE